MVVYKKHFDLYYSWLVIIAISHFASWACLLTFQGLLFILHNYRFVDLIILSYPCAIVVLEGVSHSIFECRHLQCLLSRWNLLFYLWNFIYPIFWTQFFFCFIGLDARFYFEGFLSYHLFHEGFSWAPRFLHYTHLGYTLAKVQIFVLCSFRIIKVSKFLSSG